MAWLAGRMRACMHGALAPAGGGMPQLYLTEVDIGVVGWKASAVGDNDADGEQPSGWSHVTEFKVKL